jgi:AraC-like DNA-binding protein
MAANPSNKVRAWTAPSLGGTLFLEADFGDQRFERHYHDEFAIGVIDAGCQAFAYDQGRRLDMPEGSVALIAPGIVHTGWSGAEGGWRYRMLYPSAAMVMEAAEEIFGNRGFGTMHCPVVSDRRLYRLLTELHTLCGQATAAPMAVDAVYLSIVHVMFESHAGQTPPPRTIADQTGTSAMRAFIEERFSESLTLNELAAAAGVSRFQALRQFKARFGLPPHTYLRQLRVTRACNLIRGGSALADVAVAVGFTDQAHMTRAFRSTVGYTPGILAAQ